MKKKNLLITFDYELFLGKRSGQPDDCMLQPTSALATILGQFGVKAVFFVDTTYLCKLKELSATHPKCANDLKRIGDQVLSLVDEGHYALPHVHPHWLDAQYLPKTGEFDLTNVDRYRFHNLTVADRRKVFGDSVNILKEIICPKYPNYKINGFRAGGWSIQPFIDFKPVFEEFDIQYDLSVVSGLFQFSTAQIFDFSDAPSSFVYRFEDNITEEVQDGKFIQIAGSVIKVSSFVDYMDRAHKKMLNVVGLEQDYAKGFGQASQEVAEHTPNSTKGINIFDRTHEVASLEKLSIVKLPLYERYLEENGYLHLISHPKMLNKHNFYILRQFLKNIASKGNLETDYMNIANSYLKQQ